MKARERRQIAAMLDSLAEVLESVAMGGEEHIKYIDAALAELRGLVLSYLGQMLDRPRLRARAARGARLLRKAARRMRSWWWRLL